MTDLKSELRNQLSAATEEYRDEINEALKQVVDRIGRTGMNAIIISGSLLVSYLLYRGISGGSKKKKPKQEEDSDSLEVQTYTMLDRMADKVLEQTLVFLLTLAKERLMEYLSELSQKNEDTGATSEEEQVGREVPGSLN